MIENVLIFVGVFCIAFAFAPVGLGGGMLFVPLLHYVADMPIDGTLLAISLSLTAVVSYGSGLAHRKKGLMTMRRLNLRFLAQYQGLS